MYFDTHAHYDSGHFDADRDALLASMPGLGVDCIIDPHRPSFVLPSSALS